MATTPIEELLQRFHTATGPDDWKIRRECATALEELFVTESPSVLIQHFENTAPADYHLRISIVRALGHSTNPTALSTLLVLTERLQKATMKTLLETVAREQTLIALTEALAAHFKQDSIDALLSRYDRTDWVEKNAIIIALGHLFPKESTDRLLQRFTEREPETGFKVQSRVHAAIADALHVTFSAENIEVLLQRLTQLPDSSEAWRISSSLLETLEIQFQDENEPSLKHLQ